MEDLIIIGAGPAGLSAAIYAARGGVDVLLLESKLAGGMMLETDKIANYPGWEQPIEGARLARQMEEQAEGFGARLLTAEAQSMELEGSVKKIRTDQGLFESRAVILAMGRQPRRLGLPLEEELTGRGISYCATCDGAFYAGLPVYVAGGGDSAFSESLYLSQLASQVTILYRGSHPRAAQWLVDQAEAAGNIRLCLNTEVTRLEEEKNGLAAFHLINRKTGEEKTISGNMGLFIFIGAEPRTAMLEGRISMEKGYLLTDEGMETSLEGVYAAGDIRKKSLYQIATAVGEGAIAASSVIHLLQSERSAS